MTVVFADCLIWAFAFASKFELIFACAVLLRRFLDDEDFEPLLEFLAIASTEG
jgi:hypothetical protein